MANQLSVFDFNDRSQTPTQSDGSISVVSLEDLEAGRYSPSLIMSNDNEYASDDTLDSMENGQSRVNKANSKYLRTLLKIPEPKQVELTDENIQPRKLSLVRPVSFEEQVTELKNVLSGYTRDVVVTAIETLNLTPKISKQQYSVDNAELHAPLKNAWNKSYWENNGFESDFEEELAF